MCKKSALRGVTADVGIGEINSMDKLIVILTGEKLQWLKELIANRETHSFYVCPEWRHLQKEVLKEQKKECQCHKERGGYCKANHVHHINYVRIHPELALSKWYMDGNGIIKRNLIAVCQWCHLNVCHPERLRKAREPITVERW